MRVRILRSTVAGGGVVEAGSVHDLPAEDAAVLIRLKKAELAPERPPASAPAVSSTSTTHGDPTAAHRDPKPRGRR